MKTAEQVAKELGTSKATIERNAVRAELHDALPEAGEKSGKVACASACSCVCVSGRRRRRIVAQFVELADNQRGTIDPGETIMLTVLILSAFASVPFAAEATLTIGPLSYEDRPCNTATWAPAMGETIDVQIWINSTVPDFLDGPSVTRFRDLVQHTYAVYGEWGDARVYDIYYGGNSFLDSMSVRVDTGTGQAVFVGRDADPFDQFGCAFDLTVASYTEDLLFGDANRDGKFDSGDLVTVFTAGKYETGEVANWSEGDWFADARFTSRDLVEAFALGTYEQAAPAVVPEPSAVLLLAIGCGLVIGRQRAGQ